MLQPVFNDYLFLTKAKETAMPLHGYLPAIGFAFGAGLIWYIVKVLVDQVGLPKGAIIALRGWLAGPPLLVAALLTYDGWPTMTWEFFWCFPAAVALNLAMMYVTLVAFEKCDLSTAVHLRSFAPLCAVATSWLILGAAGVPSAIGVTGIAVMIIGVYVLHTDSSSVGWAGPLRKIWRERHIWLTYAVLMTLIMGFLFTLDKKLVLLTNPLFAPASVCVTAWVGFGSIWALYEWRQARVALAQAPKRRLAKLIVLLGCANILVLVCHGLMTEVGYAAAVGSLKRLESLPAVIFAWLWLEEKHLAYRLPGTLLIIAGAIIIGFDSPAN